MSGLEYGDGCILLGKDGRAVLCVCGFSLHVIEIGYPRSYDGDDF